ncbi:sugar ABC transporter ATP-binding protein [Paracoccus seriniphilus]|uniref:Ribose/galactose/methyl galactoside import ATP-binding protein n=1 Tax=Paracoccus seriniphilus TaxID=184748 RepID=A0A239Q1M2_9RHOB|nr:sugar ABC transporter ATP-binding protein [Paracoccus seriniphilus]WCR15084.1 sugar ABC transporter ATP-binding protein [Paracoccus seriniphilus]SNT76102.1 monosaccharide ABC transporter ATP-binding protein, CUT2 family [Paracoccus seriniphilus]
MLDAGVEPARESFKGEFILEVDHVRKEFPGVVALDDVQLRIRPGSVHALMGENGAGKSTLMKIIAGIYSPDRGEVRFAGKPLNIRTPIDALNSGIAMIHQELNLMNSMTVAENVWIGREPRNGFGLIDHAKMNRMAADLFADLNIKLNPRAMVGDLTVAQKQMIEIAKAVSYNSDVLIMDEPTSAITESEVEHLFRIIRDLRAKGVGIVYITHKMDELFEIADELTVFRDGKYITTVKATDVTRDDIITMMVGREITDMFPKIDCEIGEVTLEVRNLSREGQFRDVSFQLHKGEILGVAGLVGSGRSEVAESVFGMHPADSGEILIDGNPVDIRNPGEAMRHGMAFLTEDRKESGCFLILDCQENVQMALLAQGKADRFGFIDGRRVEGLVQEYIQKLRVKTPGLAETVQNLSGGNQQKLLIARWLLTNPSILILDEPTRGIDVGAKSEIHRLITQLAAQGVAILMISSELPEVLGMSDRIMVMHEGHVSGFLDRSEADQVSIMQLAAK